MFFGQAWGRGAGLPLANVARRLYARNNIAADKNRLPVSRINKKRVTWPSPGRSSVFRLPRAFRRYSQHPTKISNPSACALCASPASRALVGYRRSQYRSAQRPAVPSVFLSSVGPGRTRFCSIWQAPWPGIAACNCSGGIARALSHCQIEHVTNLLARPAHTAATTSRHVDSCPVRE